MIFTFTPELRDMSANGTYYGFVAPETEIQPSFEEMWNGFVAMFAAIDDYNARMTPTDPPPCPINVAPSTVNYNTLTLLTALMTGILLF